MTKLIIDQATLSKLNELRDKAEFCTESGTTLGFCTPAPSRDRALYENVEIPFTDEQLDEFEREPGGRTLWEIRPIWRNRREVHGRLETGSRTTFDRFLRRLTAISVKTKHSGLHTEKAREFAISARLRDLFPDRIAEMVDSTMPDCWDN